MSSALQVSFYGKEDIVAFLLLIVGSFTRQVDYQLMDLTVLIFQSSPKKEKISV